MTKVMEVMTKEVLTVKPETPISVAIKLLVMERVTGLPVVNDDSTIVGIVSEKDLMRILMEKESLKEKTVRDYMTKNVQSFSPDDNMVDVCKFLLDHNFRRVPIAQDGKLVGIVSRRDIIKLIWKEKYELDQI
ncbi:MAG: CBS domain-containing protein [Candidatus Omnitrophica bacterium]|nr:CBS domain-containing protein [Candidatus Omnitrophota bacterium]